MWTQKPPIGTQLDWGSLLNDGLVLHLACNEGHGDVVRDLSMHGNHGTLDGFVFPPTAASGWNPGQTGVGLNLDGVNNYINCGNNPSLNVADEITISTIINVPRTQHSSLFGKNYNSTWSAYVHTDGSIRFHARVGGATRLDWLRTDGVGAVPANEWANVVWTYDSTTARIYVDGISLPVTQTHTGVLGTNTSNLHIGARSPAALYFKGSLDQPRIQSRAWTPKEVRDYAINPWKVYLDE